MTLRPKNGDKSAKRFIAPKRACLHVLLAMPASIAMAEADGFEPMDSSRHALRAASPSSWTFTDFVQHAGLRPFRFAERLVRELNPSHSIDSGAATPVASRGMIPCVPGRTRSEVYGVHEVDAVQ